MRQVNIAQSTPSIYLVIICFSCSFYPLNLLSFRLHSSTSPQHLFLLWFQPPSQLHVLSRRKQTAVLGLTLTEKKDQNTTFRNRDAHKRAVSIQQLSCSPSSTFCACSVLALAKVASVKSYTDTYAGLRIKFLKPVKVPAESHYCKMHLYSYSTFSTGIS